MVDNLTAIKELLVFDTPDDFYHLQIIKRKKEYPELGSNSYIVKTYYISSIEYLENKYTEIKALADFHNARACINLNRRSFEKIAFHLMKKLSDQIMNRDYRSARKAYESVCGAYSNEKNKKWIVDIDVHYPDNQVVAALIGDFINKIEPVGEKVLANLPTKNGLHLITKPFNTQTFKERYPDTDLHRDNPTILYIP